MIPAGAATSENPGPGGTPPGRLEAIDLARGAALVAMAVYHFTWDLEHFGYVLPGLTATGGWKLFARAIASTFLFIAGISLVVGHGERIRLRPFLRRTATVAGSALAITIATRLLFPSSFVFFGILHHIAVAGLVGLAVLRLPASVLAALALVAFIIGNGWQSPAFDPRAVAWIGFSQSVPRSNDFVPLFPWLAASLSGMAAWKAATGFGLAGRLRAIRARGLLRPLSAAGRHSLLIYLLHQPILFGLVALAAMIAPPAPVAPETRFTAACARSCEPLRPVEFCMRYCACALGAIAASGKLQALLDGDDEDARIGMERISSQCTAETDALLQDTPQ